MPKTSYKRKYLILDLDFQRIWWQSEGMVSGIAESLQIDPQVGIGEQERVWR